MTILKSICESPHVHRKRLVSVCALLFAFLQVVLPRATMAQASPPAPPARQEVIGRLSGDDVSVTGALAYQTENGRTTALLASGSDLTLRSGQAQIDLPDGGDIILCGPAHLSVVKSGPAITIALEYGQVHLQVGAGVQITVYTALLVVTPEAIGDRSRDLTVGLDRNGQLCVTAVSGALRIEEQFTAEKLVVPQGGNIQIDGGELQTVHGGSNKCSCELLVSQIDIGRQVEAPPPARSSPAPIPSHPTDEIVSSSRIDMPPLSFDASSPAAAPVLSSEAMTVIRESVAYTQPTFRGAIRPALPSPPSEPHRPASRTRSSRPNFFARLFGIFHHRKTVCGGADCTTAES